MQVTKSCPSDAVLPFAAASGTGGDHVPQVRVVHVWVSVCEHVCVYMCPCVYMCINGGGAFFCPGCLVPNNHTKAYVNYEMFGL